MTIGPIQLVVLEFEDNRFTGEILPALRAAHRQGVIRLLDLLFLQKDASGTLHTLQASDLSPEERLRFGAVVGALLGIGAGTVAGGLQAGAVGSKVGAVMGAVEGIKAAVNAFAQDEYGLSQAEIQAIAQHLPTGQAAALVLFEHQWAIPFKEAVLKAHGQVLAEGLLTPETLVALGARLQAARTAAEMADDTQR
jgi:uncharacterized membrane protein